VYDPVYDLTPGEVAVEGCEPCAASATIGVREEETKFAVTDIAFDSWMCAVPEPFASWTRIDKAVEEAPGACAAVTWARYEARLGNL
jgi:hypothetical protein